MDESAGTASGVSAKDGISRTDNRSPWRARVVYSMAIVLIAVVGLLSWQRWYEGAPDLGDRGAATASVYCGLVTVYDEGRPFQSELGAPGASGLEASWGDRQIPGRLHLDDRHRKEHKQWTVTGRFIADDGTEVEVSGSYGDRYSVTTVDCG